MFNLQIKLKTKFFSERLKLKWKTHQKNSLIVLILPECFEAKSYAHAAVSNHLMSLSVISSPPSRSSLLLLPRLSC